MKFSSFAISAALGLLSASVATAEIIAQFTVFPGYQCDSGGTVLEIDESAIGVVETISGSGAATLQAVASGCTVIMCFAGDSCNGVDQSLDFNTCRLASSDGANRLVWDKYFVSC
ncbi:hypothetical protein F5884DRAFT_748437 [Xylogone sp. PMI_703]|nr:hypothetical protein F5884DRAFT_748437 [Xylogone sp. PMI_703]